MALKHSTKFYLTQTKVNKKPTSLRAFVSYNSIKVPFSTNIYIEPRYWNSSSQEARQTSMFDGSSINTRLKNIIDFVDAQFEQFTSFPEPDWFQSICENFIRTGSSFVPESNDHPEGIIGFIRKMAKDSRSGVRVISRGNRKGQRFKPQSIKNYDSVVFVLEKYAKHKLRQDFAYNDINMSFYDDFSRYFYDKLEHSVLYFAMVIKTIKTAMTEAAEQKLHNNTSYKSSRFIKPSYDADTIYLTLEQLKKLQEHDFGKDEYLSNARDLFLVGCWTGLRFSDFSTLRSEDFNDEFIRVKAEKTSERIAIPFHPMLRKIIAKYDGGIPRSITNQKLNKYIKEAAEAAGFTHTVTVRKSERGVDVNKEVRFCDLITTHAARRSFATNMFKKGVPTLLIMAITGHKTEASFLKYIRVSNEEKAKMMAELWKNIQWD